MTAVGKSAPIGQRGDVVRGYDGWSAHRDNLCRDEKQLMASHFSGHEFLVREGSDPESDPRLTVASILVNPGTTPNTVVREALGWISQQAKPFDITWYTPGTLVPRTLLEFRLESPSLQKAAQLFLVPGLVDVNVESVIGPEAEEFAERLDVGFTYACLSCCNFDLRTGTVRFHHPTELRLQRACALRRATRKYLFLDSSKFADEERPVYTIAELLATSESVTLYTVSSGKDQWIREMFEELGGKVFAPSGSGGAHNQADLKALRLIIVGKNDTPTHVSEPRVGFLRKEYATVTGLGDFRCPGQVR